MTGKFGGWSSKPHTYFWVGGSCSLSMQILKEQSQHERDTKTDKLSHINSSSYAHKETVVSLKNMMVKKIRFWNFGAVPQWWRTTLFLLLMWNITCVNSGWDWGRQMEQTGSWPQPQWGGTSRLQSEPQMAQHGLWATAGGFAATCWYCTDRQRRRSEGSCWHPAKAWRGPPGSPKSEAALAALLSEPGRGRRTHGRLQLPLWRPGGDKTQSSDLCLKIAQRRRANNASSGFSQRRRDATTWLENAYQIPALVKANRAKPAGGDSGIKMSAWAWQT